MLLQFEEAIATKTNREKLSEGSYVYEKAVKCSFVLRQIQDDEAWREYIKEIYERHSRKINLWREFKRVGVTVKRVKKDIKVELRLA